MSRALRIHARRAGLARLRGLALPLAVLALAAVAAGPVRAEAQRSSQDVVREALEAFLRERAPGEHTRVQLPALDDFALPDVAPEEAQVLLSSHPQQRYQGSVPVTVVLRVDGEERKRGVVTAHLTVMLPTLVAAHALPKGSSIGPGDLRSEPRDATGLPGDALSDPADVEGLQAARSIRAGTVLRARFLEAPQVVARGQVVELRFESGPLRIVGHGRAKENGRAGDWIRVENSDSGRAVTGRLDAEGVVHVVF